MGTEYVDDNVWVGVHVAQMLVRQVNQRRSASQKDVIYRYTSVLYVCHGTSLELGEWPVELQTFAVKQ